MSLCKMKSSMTLMNEEVNAAVANYMGSLRFMKKLVPMSICNIVYHRIDMDDKVFEKCKTLGIEYVVFKQHTRKHIAVHLHYWAKGAAEALEKKYLRELFLIFKKNNVIVESYKFSFTYKEESESHVKVKSEDLIKQTSNYFKGIEALGSYRKLEEDIDIVTEVTFYEGTPEECKIAYFEKCAPGAMPLCMQLPKATTDNCINIGNISTGHHFVKCRGSGKVFYTTPSNTPFSAKSDRNDILITDADLTVPVEVGKTNVNKDVNNSIDNVNVQTPDNIETLSIISLSDGSEIQVDEEDNTSQVVCTQDIKCPCGISAIINDISNVLCSICLKFQHSVCVGYHHASAMPETYVCVNCATSDKPATDKKLYKYSSQNWPQMCFIRLVVMYCYTFKKMPDFLFRLLPEDVSGTLFKKIIQMKLIFKEKHKWVINYMKVEQILAGSLFYSFNMPESMDLETRSTSSSIERAAVNDRELSDSNESSNKRRKLICLESELIR